MGCENVSFRTEEHDYWDVDLEDDEEIGEKHKTTVQLFPLIIKGHSEIKNLYTVPSKIADVYSQTILALKGNSNLLAGVGFRAVIEAICIQEKIKGNNLEIKINNLAKNRLITEREAERLHTIRFLGNDSVHEMEIPTESKLMLVLDIIENLLKNIYILDKEAKSILDTYITEYSEFEDFLWRSIQAYLKDEEKNIKGFLGKHIRRIKIDLESAEKILINKINSGNIEFLKLGQIIKNSDNTETQLFIYTGKEYDDLPF
ncbi:hypothetical protein FUMI01_18420 [Flavobacterium sp. UMI-01]|nr:hypothetical protein FUMI01_18420 [Flavobacterium sp. UMI-01]